MKSLKPKTGRVLLSDPFLKDPNFIRTVVLLAEYNKSGCLGFVLNNLVDLKLNTILKDKTLPPLPVYQGGPVELNTLHLLHNLGQIIPDSIQLCREVWWGGDVSHALKLLRQNEELSDHMRFYIGYSGWAEGQLDFELEEEAWVVADISSKQVFHQYEETNGLWKELIKNMGGAFKHLSNAPIDPQLN